MAHQLAPDLLQELFALRDRIAATPHGCATELVHNFASLIGRNPSTVYTWLRTHAGYRTGRKKRADAGESAISDADLDTIAGTIQGVRLMRLIDVDAEIAVTDHLDNVV